jgi:hypothetical protein
MSNEGRLAGKRWWAEDDELIWQDMMTGTRGRLKTSHPTYQILQGLSILEIHLAPAKDGLLLLQPAQRGYRILGDLARVSAEGDVEWWAELTDAGTDNYSAVHATGDGIRVSSWNGFSCQIDAAFGQIIEVGG